MAETPPKTGRLEEPVIVRGFDPLTAPRGKGPIKRFDWARHIEVGRVHPARWDPIRGDWIGGWMKVSEVKKGGCKARREAIRRDKSRIEGWLDRYAPLERWQLRTVTVEGTWCDMELYLRYVETLTPEQDRADRQARRARWAARQAVVNENRARRAQEARDKALQQEAAARLRIRGGRRPGQ